MKAKLTTVLSIVMMFTMVLVAAGCGKPTLDEWYNDNRAELFDKIIESANADQNRTTTDIRVEDSNVLLYSVTLLDEFPVDEESYLTMIATLYESKYEDMQAQFTQWLARMQEETKTKNIVIRFTVFNSDGITVLYSQDFTQ